jgi:small subunit ribosomal protein S16
MTGRPECQVEILPVIWHNEQVLDLRGPSLRVRILSFRTP